MQLASIIGEGDVSPWGGPVIARDEPRSVPLRPEAPLESARSWRRWLLVPDALELVSDFKPQTLAALLQRVDTLGPGSEKDEIVGYDPASHVLPFQWIREPQCHLPGKSTPCLRLIAHICERRFVYAERILKSTTAKEPKAPSAPAGGPDEP